jgi:hypothetical protein
LQVSDPAPPLMVIRFAAAGWVANAMLVSAVTAMLFVMKRMKLPNVTSGAQPNHLMESIARRLRKGPANLKMARYHSIDAFSSRFARNAATQRGILSDEFCAMR